MPDSVIHAILDTDGTVVLASRTFDAWVTPPRLDVLRRVREAVARGAVPERPPDFALELAPISGRAGHAYLASIRPTRASALSRRQLEVAELAAVGATVREIGHALGISENTVRQHLKAIYAVLGVANRVELARLV